VTELPYQVNKAGWIEKVADLVNQNKLDGITDIRDESDRDGMRVVIELKRDVQPSIVLNHLYRMTPLQNNFGIILLAIADNQPRQLPLRDMLQHFLDFREETLTRQYSHELQKAESRAHILEGLLSALDSIDEIIDILRNAPDGSTAKMQLQESLEFSDRQADAILAMPLRRLTSMERQNYQTEFDEINQRIEELRRLLNNRKELLKSLKKDLRALKKKFSDERRSRILSAEQHAKETAQLAEITAEEAAAEQETVLEFTQRGYVRRMNPKTFQKQQSKQEEQPLRTLVEAPDFTTQIDQTTTENELLVLTRSGKAYTIGVGDIPATPRQSKGSPVISLLPSNAQGDPETILTQFVLSKHAEDLEGWYLVMLTLEGRIKRVALAEFVNLSGRGLVAMKLKEGDELVYAVLVEVGDQLVIGTTGGRVLRFQVDDEQIPVMSRSAQGVQIVRLRKQEALAGCVALGTEDEMLLVTTQGYAKRMVVNLARRVNRGDLGIQGIQFSNKTDTLVAIVPAFPETEVIFVTDGDRIARLPVEDVPQEGREGSGKRVLKLEKKEKVVNVVLAETTVVEGGEN
jgi:DNA gyrase subunit A